MTLLADSTWMRLVEFLFGIDSASAGQGRESKFDPSAPFPTWVTIALLVFVVVYVFLIYSREHSTWRAVSRYVLATLRVAVIGLAIFMLFRLVVLPYRTDLPDLVIVLDDSGSMSHVDTYEDTSLASSINSRLSDAKFGEATRLNLAKTLLLEEDADLLTQLNERYNVKFYLASTVLRPLGATIDASESDVEQGVPGQLRELAADRPESKLGRCLLDVMAAQRGRPTAAIILLSDGVTTEGKTIADAAEVARRKAIPLFIIGLGNPQPQRDLWVASVTADEIAFVGDVVPFDFRISGSGFAGRRVQVRLKDETTGQILDTADITIGEDGQTGSGRLRHRPDTPGEMKYVVEIVAPSGDSNSKNDFQPRVVDVRDETIRVLLVQDYPNYEFRYLKNLLSRQLKEGGGVDDQGKPAKSIELTTVLQSGSRDYAALDETALPVFPVRRDELFEYDVLIFGDVNPAFLSRNVMENIAAFVKKRGGGIIFMAGPRYTPLAYRDSPLAELFPVNLDVASVPHERAVLTESIQMHLTNLGMSAPNMQLDDTPNASLARWNKLPGIYWYLEAPELRSGAVVLAEHPTRTGNDGRPLPLIASQFVGAGNVIFHATDETWRWRFRTGDALFGRYWLQTIRFLSRAKLLGKARSAEIVTDRQTFRRGDVVNLRVRFFDDRQAPARDDGVAVVIEQDGGRNRRVTLNRAGRRGMFETSLAGLPPGRYRAWMAAPTMEDGAPTTDFIIEDPGGEMARLQMNAKELERAADRSGGKYYTFTNATEILKELPEGREVPIEALDPIPIWNHWRLALVFVTLLVTEWLLRKRAGMV